MPNTKPNIGPFIKEKIIKVNNPNKSADDFFGNFSKNNATEPAAIKILIKLIIKVNDLGVYERK